MCSCVLPLAGRAGRSCRVRRQGGFYDFVGDGVGAGGLSGSYSLAGSDVVAFCEMLVQC